MKEGMRMDDRTLRYVAAIAQYQNLTRAAEALYVGQPTLSKFLAGLEASLGLKLFRKVGHKYVPTYAGERYIERARAILGLIDSLEAEMADILSRDVGALNVAFANMRASYMLPLVLPAFHRRYPNVKVNVFEGSSTENDRRLLNGEVEIAFYSQPSEPNAQIEYLPLSQEELLICAPAGHPVGKLARPNPDSPWPRLPLSALENELVLMMQPEQRTRQIVDCILRENRIHLNDVLYTSNIHAIMGLVSAGYGLSFVFDSHLKHRADATPIDLYSFGHPRTVYAFMAAVRKGGYLSGYGRDFIEEVRHTL